MTFSDLKNILFSTFFLILILSCEANSKKETSPNIIPDDSTSNNDSLDNHLQISSATGTFVGIIEKTNIANEALSFKGIPYAKPPVGDLRWFPPMPIQPSSNVQDAKAFSPICPQKNEDQELASSEMSEDCLYLNIWRPLLKTFPLEQKLPVIVWIHGGGFTSGAASKKVYSGANMAAKGVVFVSMNYRLNHLGFFAHPGQNQNNPRGNYGILDQIEALRWIQKNITFFGGNSENITLIGESAGAVSVVTHITSKKSAGLFHKAIIQSAPVFINTPGISNSRLSEDDSAEVISRKIAEGLDCQNSALSQEMNCLRNKPYEDILKYVSSKQDVGGKEGLRSGLYIDGNIHEDEPYKVLLSGGHNKVPIIVGSNADEATYFGAPPVRTLVGFNLLLASLFDEESADAIYNYYNPQNNLQVSKAYLDFLTDYMFKADSLRLVQIISEETTPSYHYQFNRVGPGAEKLKLGASHGFEIPYFFNNLDDIGVQEDIYNEIDKKLALEMSNRLYNFVLRGEPNIDLGVKWDHYESPSNNSFIIGNITEQSKNYFTDGMLLYWNVKSEFFQ